MRSIKILKIKPWMIKFKVTTISDYTRNPIEKIYFIKDGDEWGESTFSLYEYSKLDDKGHYTTKPLAGRYGFFNVDDFVIWKNGMTYKKIDTTNFLAALAECGFGEYVGMDEDLITRYKVLNKQNRLKARWNRLKDEMDKVEAELKEIENYDSRK